MGYVKTVEYTRAHLKFRDFMLENFGWTFFIGGFMEIFLNILLLILGMVFLIKGADFFVEGSSNIAKALKIPSLIIGLTLVSIGTSAPELSVSVTSAIQGLNDLSFGNVIGSNIFNILIVVGISAIIHPIVVKKEMFRFDLPIYLGICVLLLLFAFLGSSSYELSLWESIVIFSLFFLYMIFLIFRGLKDSKKNKNIEEEEVVTEEIIDDSFMGKIKKIWKKKPWWLNLLLVAIGLLGIIFGGNFVVDSASSLAISFGMSEALVGLTIVSIGTSLPELVTSMVAAKKGENDIAVGNAVGSCIFNIVLILGLSSTIRPMHISTDSIIDIVCMLVSGLLIFFFALFKKKIVRWQGLVFVVLYILYFSYIIGRQYFAY